MRRLLTDRFCATAKPRDGEAQTDYFDTQASGLALRVSEGRKSWTFHYTLDKRRRLTFGSYPTISLASARTRADEARIAIASGQHPSPMGRTETLRDICELYQAKEGAQLRTAEWRKRLLDRYVYPTLGSRPIAEIKRSEIVRLLDHVEEKSGGPAMARLTLALIRKRRFLIANRERDGATPRNGKGSYPDRRRNSQGLADC